MEEQMERKGRRGVSGGGPLEVDKTRTRRNGLRRVGGSERRICNPFTSEKDACVSPTRPTQEGNCRLKLLLLTPLASGRRYLRSLSIPIDDLQEYRHQVGLLLTLFLQTVGCVPNVRLPCLCQAIVGLVNPGTQRLLKVEEAN